MAWRQACSPWLWYRGAILIVCATFARGDDRILTAGAINDLPAKFALDTGAGLPFVAVESKAAAFALTDRGQPGANRAPSLDVVGQAHARSITVFGRKYSDVTFSLIADGSPALVKDFDALIGWPAVRDGVVLLDLGDNTATYTDEPPKVSWGWHTFSIVTADVLVLETGSRTESSRVLVDTGLDDGVHLGATAWTDWLSHHSRDRYALDAAYSPGQGVLVRRQYFSARLKLGGLVLKNVMVSAMTDLDQHLAGTNVDAVIGMAALRHLKMYVEGGRHIARVREAGHANLRQNYNRLGAVFVPKGGDMSALYATVAPGSPAASADIRDGDILVEVDGRSTADYLDHGISFSSLWNRPPGTSCRLIVQRGGQRLKKDIVLASYLD